MQLEQQESFTITGPQLEVFGRWETKLPAPAKKKPFALSVVVLAAVVAVFGMGGAQMKGAYNRVQATYTATDAYNNGIQTDFAVQADSAASLIKVAGNVLGTTDTDVMAAADALGAWNANTDRTAGTQYALNTRLYHAVDTLYTAAKDEADSKAAGQLDDLRDSFVSAQNTIDRAAAAYNEDVAAYRRSTAGFPASLIGALWGANDLAAFE